MDWANWGRCTRCHRTRPLNETQLCITCAEKVLYVPTHKYCPRCQIAKPLTEFTNPQESYCRPCKAAYMRDYPTTERRLALQLFAQRRAKRALTQQIITEFRQSLEKKAGKR